MSVFAIGQGIVLALILLVCIWQAFRKLLPATAKRQQARLSMWLERPAHGGGLRRLGRWLQPGEAKSGGCGTGDGCGSCGGCAPAAVTPPRAEAQPLHFRPRSR